MFLFNSGSLVIIYSKQEKEQGYGWAASHVYKYKDNNNQWNILLSINCS